MNAFDFMLRNWRAILELTGEHLLLVAVSTLIAVAVGIPAGLLLTRRPRLKRPVLGVANVLQTVPSLALFGFLIPLPLVGGIGARAAVVALVLYALLPVIRNTVTGVEGVDRSVREAAVAMGMTDRQVLRQVELPPAAPGLLARAALRRGGARRRGARGRGLRPLAARGARGRARRLQRLHRLRHPRGDVRA